MARFLSPDENRQRSLAAHRHACACFHRASAITTLSGATT